MITAQPYPKVSILSGRRILIRGLSHLNDDAVRQASIIPVIHQVKNLFDEGDRFGNKGRKYRLRHGIPLEETSFKINFSHTLVSRPNGDVIIGIWYNSARTPTKQDELGSEVPLTAEEIETAMDLIVKICAFEVKAHFADIRHAASISGDTPDYCQGVLPYFWGTMPVVPAC